MVNPHLLHLQFRQDAIEQAGRKDNLRISGLAEEERDETEEILIEKICKVAGETGMQLAESDISACHRLGRKVAGKKRDTVVRFVAQRKRDKVYQGRFHLKGKESFRQVFVNEDLTSTRYAVLMAAKKSAEVKSVSTKAGNIVCKMNDDTFKIISTPDDLFAVGLDNVEYKNFRLRLLE